MRPKIQLPPTLVSRGFAFLSFAPLVGSSFVVDVVGVHRGAESCNKEIT